MSYERMAGWESSVPVGRREQPERGGGDGAVLITGRYGRS
ncbi:hypothetical protein SAMN05428953_12944 [Mesorhizobium muleiense]|uniref:Uncharacterized protein n=1 Tax=Mesorhizobium muleiense TaxID=1004279 RepID=A0A1G9I677_9HYPH|nr:hypothetical protein SAMN05428953_12944 [Mesorhizobium muleiense]